MLSEFDGFIKASLSDWLPYIFWFACSSSLSFWSEQERISQPPALPSSYLALSALPLAPDCWTPLTGLRYQHRRSHYSDNSSSSTTSDSSSEYVYLLGGSQIKVRPVSSVLTLSTIMAHSLSRTTEKTCSGLPSSALAPAPPATNLEYLKYFQSNSGNAGGG